MTTDSTPTIRPNTDVWIRVGEQTYTLSNEDAWRLAWAIIGQLVDNKAVPGA